MAIDLEKGQRIDVGLKHITVGLGWDPNETGGEDFDLDASAFLLGANGKLITDDHFVFYNNLCGRGHKGSDTQNDCMDAGCSVGRFGVIHTGDDPSGNASEGDDDEAIEVLFDEVPSAVQEIIFVVTIHEYEERCQNFGQVDNSYIRIVDEAKEIEIAKYELGEDFSIETAVEFGKLYRHNGKWKFQAMGDGRKDGLGFYVNKYR